MREVNFYLPQYNIPQLRQVPGFESFNPSTEVLHCDKPGTGSVDAPRCFSIKLNKVTLKAGLTNSNQDSELCYLFKLNSAGKRILMFAMTKHVDDLKFTGELPEINKVMHIIQEVFGEMKVIWGDFTNCGVRHYHD